MKAQAEMQSLEFHEAGHVLEGITTAVSSIKSITMFSPCMPGVAACKLQPLDASSIKQLTSSRPEAGIYIDLSADPAGAAPRS